MSAIRNLLKKGTDYEEANLEAVKALRKEFPEVADALAGVPKKGTADAIPSGTITFWVHEGKAKFTYNVKATSQSFIGVVADIANPWGSVNSALLTGEVSSKRYSGQTTIEKMEAEGVKVY